MEIALVVLLLFLAVWIGAISMLILVEKFASMKTRATIKGRLSEPGFAAKVAALRASKQVANELASELYEGLSPLEKFCLDQDIFQNKWADKLMDF